MNEVLGLLDSLESTILEAKKLPFSSKVVLEERELLGLVDKMRTVLKNGKAHLHQSISAQKSSLLSGAPHSLGMASSTSDATDSSLVLHQAEAKASEVKKGAKEYADYVLANLQLVLTKVQHDIRRMERSIENGREVLDQSPLDAASQSTQTKSQSAYAAQNQPASRVQSSSTHASPSHSQGGPFENRSS